MADNNKNLINCRILVRDSKTGLLIADTVVEGFDYRRNVLTIAADALKGAVDDKLSLLVLSKSGVLEYSGTLRKNVNNTVEIALYGERKKEDRNFTRYEMKAEGRVEALLINDERIDLRKPIPISVINISANGILFRGDIDAFRRGSKVRVRVGLKDDNAFVSEYEIVRSQNRNKATAEYGCRNILPEGEQDDGTGNKDPKLLREEIARRRISKGGEIEEAEEAMLLEQEESSYDVLQLQLEQAYGYTDWMNRINRLQQEEMAQEAAGDDLQTLIEDIYQHATKMDEAVILNCVHRKRPVEEQRSRHALNLALIGALMGKWLHLEEQMIKKLIEMGLLEETDESVLERERNLALYVRILSVAELYDSRASHPTRENAGIPLVFLEQMRYRGINQPTGSVKMLEWVLAENILHCISRRMVLLADNSIGKLLYVLPNDVGHPIIAVKKEVYQEIAPWNLLWIIVKPEGEQENRGENH